MSRALTIYAASLTLATAALVACHDHLPRLIGYGSLPVLGWHEDTFPPCDTIEPLWPVPEPVYTLLATTAGGDVHAVDTGLTYDDCRNSDADASPVWVTSICVTE